MCFLVLLSLFRQKCKKAVFFKSQICFGFFFLLFCVCWVGVFCFFFLKKVHLVYVFHIFISSQILLWQFPLMFFSSCYWKYLFSGKHKGKNSEDPIYLLFCKLNIANMRMIILISECSSRTDVVLKVSLMFSHYGRYQFLSNFSKIAVEPYAKSLS